MLLCPVLADTDIAAYLAMLKLVDELVALHEYSYFASTAAAVVFQLSLVA
jgi:hypothetical protein